jgi:hypothetical protein
VRFHGSLSARSAMVLTERKTYGLSNPLSRPRVLPRAYAPRGGLMTVTRPYRRARALGLPAPRVQILAVSSLSTFTLHNTP